VTENPPYLIRARLENDRAFETWKLEPSNRRGHSSPIKRRVERDRETPVGAIFPKAGPRRSGVLFDEKGKN
jgi:hypothetical protein